MSGDPSSADRPTGFATGFATGIATGLATGIASGSEGPATATTAPLRGTWGTVLLPIRADESIDFSALEGELDVLLEVGLAGVYTCGTAGEFHTLEEDEFDALSELVAQKARRAGAAFQIGASHMSGQVCLSRIRRARALEPTAIQVILPDWSPLRPTEVERSLERMLQEAGGIPVVLYNPPHAKTSCSAEQLAALARAFPGLAGVKVAGDDTFYSQLHAAAPQLSIFAPGHELAHARRLGAVGSYSNVACLAPVGALTWERQMGSDPDGAEELGTRIMAFFDAYIGPLKAQGYSNTALDKALAAVGGWAPIGTRARWPYSSVPEDEVAVLAPLARAALPELF
jgi:dihydrodipicolinate synthase/N-acetylneuraminate lyase